MATAALAQQTYADRSTTIRAGVLILDGAAPALGAEPASAGPHVWYNLDANKSVKPAAWTFVNPHASRALSTSDRSRWLSIQTGTSPVPPTALQVPAVNTRLTKRTAPYWEVRLSRLTDSQIADYDVLVFNPAGPNGMSFQLNPSEREKLRRFVDRGGVLWIDPVMSQPDVGNSFPVSFEHTTATAFGSESVDYTQPLVSSPQQLSGRDLSLLQASATSTFDWDFVQPNNSFFAKGLFGDLYGSFARVQPVIGLNSGRFSMGVARYGAGFVVLTGRSVSLKLNRSVPQEAPQNLNLTLNRGFFARDPVLQADGIAAAKLAINIVSLGRGYSQPQGSSQKAGSSAIDLGAPLLRRGYDSTVAGLTTPPVLYKGLLVVSAGNRIRVYDADPNRDIDGDGRADDGLFDGTSRVSDLIWQSSAQGTLSAPVCAEIPNINGATGGKSDVVMAVDSRGRLLVWNLFTFVNGILDNRANIVNAWPPVATLSPSNAGTAAASGVPKAPTVHDGFAYIADDVSGGQGRVWMVSLADLAVAHTTRDWYYGGNGATLPPISASPTVGYIPIYDNSGGVDKVLYAPTAPQSTQRAAGFVSMWLGAKGEKPAEYHPSGDETGSALEITTRAARNRLPIFAPSSANPNGVKLTLLRADGSVYTTDQTNALFASVPTADDSGNITIPFANGRNQLPADVTGVRVDYSIDYGYGDSSSSIQDARRGDLTLPDTLPGRRNIIGSLVMGADSTLFMSTTGSNGRSALFGIREEGVGSFKCRLRYELSAGYTYPTNGAGDVRMPTSFEQNDGIKAFMGGFANIPFGGYTFDAPPVVRNGIVYAVASGVRFAGAPKSAIILAFNAEPDTVTFRVGDFPSGSSLVQPELARSTTQSRPEAIASLQSNVSFNSDSGMVRIDNLSSTSNSGQWSNVLNLSQPVLVRRPGRSDELIYPDNTTGARYNPLLWYQIVEAFNPASAGITVTGDTLFLTGKSPVRIGLSTKPFSIANFSTYEGMIYATDVNVASNSTYLVKTSGREWLKQNVQLVLNAAGTGFADANPGVKWPQLRGTTSVDDYLIRLRTSVLDSSDDVLGLAAGEGVLAATGTGGLYTFSRSDFMVADQGRIATFDPAGNATSEFTSSTGSRDDGTNAGVDRRLVNPTRAYPLPNGELLVVDPGSNRVVRINQAGEETRTLSEMRLDPNLAPRNYPANAPLTLSGPQDALTFSTVETTASVSAYLTPNTQGSAYEQWVHYVVADTGNRRLVEVVDRYLYDPATGRRGAVVRLNGVAQFGVLLWQSPPVLGATGFAYNSLSRVYVPGATVGASKYVFFAGVGNSRPTGVGSLNAAAGAGRGAVVVFDPAVPLGAKVINQIAIPGIAANVLFNEASGLFDAPARDTQTKSFSNIASVTAYYDPSSTTIRVMVADDSGVYEFNYSPSTTVANATWMMPNEVYRVLRRTSEDLPASSNPRDLRATYARRLETGEVLIVNGYNGTCRDKSIKFTGEVVQIGAPTGSARNLGYDTSSITFVLPPVQGARGLVLPVFADRR